jgi:hypothetical protein
MKKTYINLQGIEETIEGTPQEIAEYEGRAVQEFKKLNCKCQQSWLGIIPPPCPVHNPTYTATTTTGNANLGTTVTVVSTKKVLL